MSLFPLNDYEDGGELRRSIARRESEKWKKLEADLKEAIGLLKIAADVEPLYKTDTLLAMLIRDFLVRARSMK